CARGYRSDWPNFDYW
nr:immunoglobulin heavy chain junction region [Macaca mulatta]